MINITLNKNSYNLVNLLGLSKERLDDISLKMATEAAKITREEGQVNFDIDKRLIEAANPQTIEELACCFYALDRTVSTIIELRERDKMENELIRNLFKKKASKDSGFNPINKN